MKHWLPVAFFVFATAVQAETVACHITYGGETRVIAAAPVATPYTVPTVEIGSYFLFRLVFQNLPADQAAIKTYTYASRDGGPVLIHQATFSYPPPAATRYGFSGMHHVYETLRDGELLYWCELKS